MVLCGSLKKLCVLSGFPGDTGPEGRKADFWARLLRDQKYSLDRILVWFWIKMAKIQVVEH